MNKITIDFERCKGCGLCVDGCHDSCIEISEYPNASGAYPARFKPAAECKACTQCATVCPDAAIEVYRVKKAKA